LTAAKTPVIAQYAPKTPKTTLRIAVLLISKAPRNALTMPALAVSRPSKPAAANDSLYPHLTPAAVNN
jgi:hypothetical protein